MFYRNILFALENGIHQVILTPQCKADGVSELSCQIHSNGLYVSERRQPLRNFFLEIKKKLPSKSAFQ